MSTRTEQTESLSKSDARAAAYRMRATYAPRASRVRHESASTSQKIDYESREGKTAPKSAPVSHGALVSEKSLPLNATTAHAEAVRKYFAERGVRPSQSLPSAAHIRWGRT